MRVMAHKNRKLGPGLLRRASAAVALAMAMGAGLTCTPPRALAAEADPAGQEFVAFLEYLGSWDGNEEDWVQFLDAEAPAEAEIAAAAAADPEPRHQNEDPGLEPATTGT